MNWAMASGMTMYITTESNRVSQGTGIDDTPSSRATIGAKANTITTSFSATWVRVKLALPLQRLLQTKTIAVQGAAPRSIRPAMSLSSSEAGSHGEIGRATCGERVCQSVWLSVGAV